MGTLKQHYPTIARIIICILFLLSGVAKMFPIWAFEKQLVDLDIASWCSAPYFARIIIAIEIAIGFAILQNHYIKKIVIPFTIGLLAVFCVHLTMEMVKHGAMNGNCGCFGQLIPMTPLEAFIKNIITIGLLVYLYKKVEPIEAGQNKPLVLISIYLASALFMFAFFPIAPCEDVTALEDTTEEIIPTEDVAQDTTAETITLNDATNTKVTPTNTGTKTDPKTEVKPVAPVVDGPKKVKSKFSKYNTFGSSKVNLDEGKKLVCMFVPGCDHCRDAAKEIGAMSKKEGFPEVVILFMDEEVELIPEFFDVTKTKFPYQVIGVVEFWTLLGNNANTPGVIYLWNGNIIKQYEGTEGNKFEGSDLKKQLNSK